MSKFIPTRTKTFEFDGDEVVVSYTTLKRKHLLILAPYLSEGKGTFKDQVEFVDAASEILNDVVTSFTGLTYDDGTAIDLNTAITEAYFSNLMAEIISIIIQDSMVQESEAKNSDAPQGASTLEAEALNPVTSEESTSASG